MRKGIIPDIHLKHDWVDEILKYEAFDSVVFSGDHFDGRSRVDTVEGNRESAKWVKKRMDEHPEDEFIWGNHDISYRPTGFQATNIYASCSGWDKYKVIAIHDVLPEKYWQRFKFFVWLDDRTLVSHAGLHPLLVPKEVTRADLPTWLDREAEKARLSLIHDGDHWMYRAGKARWGPGEYGGLTWCDWTREFTPYPDLNQIVGHTVGAKWRSVQGLNSMNWCLDTLGTTYGVWDGKNLQVCYAPDTIPDWTTKCRNR